MAEEDGGNSIGNDFVSREVQSALDAGNTNEPVLAHLDEWRKSLILNTLYNYQTISNPETGESSRVIVSVRYPELESVTAYAISHINLILNLPWNQVRAIYLSWWNRYRSLKKQFRGDPTALTLLRTLDGVFEQTIFGGSFDGSHQRYVWHTMGGGKMIEVRNKNLLPEAR